ncbi:TPA: glycosyltransferase [Synechococcus sp. WH 5701]
MEAAIGTVERWLEAVGEEQETPMLAFIRAHAYRLTDRADTAMEVLERFGSSEENAWIPFELGLILKALDRPEEAYLCFRRAKGIQPDFTWAAIEAANTTAEADVPLGRLDGITSAGAETGDVLNVHIDRMLRCGPLLLLIGWSSLPFENGSLFSLADPLAPGKRAVGGSTFYVRPDVCQALGRPDHESLGFAALLDVSSFHRWSELGQLRLVVQAEGAEDTRATSAEICLADIAEETDLSKVFEAVLGVFHVSIDSCNRWHEALRLFLPSTILKLSALFERHVSEEAGNVEVHWLSPPLQTGLPVASVIFVQLGSFISAKPAILQLAKTNLPLEIIVVNNSPELFSETFHLLDRFSGIRPDFRIGILNRASNLGFSAGCNLGARHASGECLVFHNNDLFADSVVDYKLLIQHALNEPNVIHSTFQYFTDGTLMQEGLTATRLTTARTQPFQLYNGYSIGRNQTRGKVLACSGSLMAMSQPLFAHLGGFSEEIVYAHFEDFDLCLRAQQEGIGIKVWNDITFFHAEGTGSVAPYHLSGTTSHINRMLFSLRWGKVLDAMDLSVEYSL